MASLLKKSLFAAVIIGGGYYVYGHFFSGGAGGGIMAGMGAPPVSVAEVIAKKTQLWSDFSGKLVAVDSAEIRPRVAGTIEKIHFKEGELVAKDAPLFTIDRKPYAAVLQAAKARAELAEADFSRAKELIKDKAIPQKEYDQRKNDVEVARAELTKANLDYDYTIVKSPIAGQVGRAEITVGNLVDAGGNAPILTTVVTNKPIYADFDIDEQTYLRYLQEAGGDAKKLQNIPVNLGASDAATAIVGKVQSFDNQINASSGTLRVRAIFDNENYGLVAGMFAHVQMSSLSDAEVLLINEHAVNTDQSVKFVWVVGDDNKVSYRPVKLAGSAEGFRVVTDGLKVGEKIVIGGTQRVMMPNQAITPKIVGMDGKDGDATTPAAEEKTAP